MSSTLSHTQMSALRKVADGQVRVSKRFFSLYGWSGWPTIEALERRGLISINYQDGSDPKYWPVIATDAGRELAQAKSA